MAVIQILASLLLLATLGSGLECQRPGVFPHPRDCTAMYTCRGSLKDGFTTQVYTCPRGTAFNEDLAQCIDISLEPECGAAVAARQRPDASDPACMETTIHCSNCSTLVICTQNINNEFVNPEYFSCQGSPTPFCDNDLKTCTAELPNGCQLPGFVCTAPGFYPDPDKCNIYHVCNANLTYESFRCRDTKPYYSSKEFRCSSNTSLEDCEVVCGGTIGITSYEADDRYYVFCQPGGGQELFSCHGNTRYNEDIRRCQFSCTAEGMFTDMDDCTRFYRCDDDGMGGFTQTSESCPLLLAFNPTSRACEAAQNVKCPPT